jgi:hypothetical protein
MIRFPFLILVSYLKFFAAHACSYVRFVILFYRAPRVAREISKAMGIEEAAWSDTCKYRDEIQEDHKERLRAYSARLHEDLHTLEIRNKRRASARVETPPKFGEYLLYFFLSKQDRINLLGDLEEDFREVHKKFSRWPAKILYYKQVICSIGPVIWKRLAKWGAIAAVEEWVRRHI